MFVASRVLKGRIRSRFGAVFFRVEFICLFFVLMKDYTMSYVVFSFEGAYYSYAERLVRETIISCCRPAWALDSCFSSSNLDSLLVVIG